MPIARTGVVNIGGIENSISNAASASAPGATTSIVSITVVAGAVYRITGCFIATGTAETQLANAQVRNAATSIALLPAITGVVVPFEIPCYTAVGTTFNVASVAAATAGSFYTAQISATRLR